VPVRRGNRVLCQLLGRVGWDARQRSPRSQYPCPCRHSQHTRGTLYALPPNALILNENRITRRPPRVSFPSGMRGTTDEIRYHSTPDPGSKKTVMFLPHESESGAFEGPRSPPVHCHRSRHSPLGDFPRGGAPSFPGRSAIRQPLRFSPRRGPLVPTAKAGAAVSFPGYVPKGGRLPVDGAAVASTGLLRPIYPRRVNPSAPKVDQSSNQRGRVLATRNP